MSSNSIQKHNKLFIIWNNFLDPQFAVSIVIIGVGADVGILGLTACAGGTVVFFRGVQLGFDFGC